MHTVLQHMYMDAATLFLLPIDPMSACTNAYGVFIIHLPPVRLPLQEILYFLEIIRIVVEIKISLSFIEIELLKSNESRCSNVPLSPRLLLPAASTVSDQNVCSA